MTINLKNFLNDKKKMSRMGEFQDLKQIDGLEMSASSADLYNNGRDDLVLFYFNETWLIFFWNHSFQFYGEHAIFKSAIFNNNIVGYCKLSGKVS